MLKTNPHLQMNLETHGATARCFIINILFQSYFNQAPELKRNITYTE